MRRSKKTLAIILMLNIIYSLLLNMFQVAFAAPEAIPIYIIVDDYKSGTLTIHWDTIPEATSCTLEYNTPNFDNTAEVHNIILDPTKNSATISGLKDDYIYGLRLDISDTTNTYAGFLYYIPRISLSSSKIDEPYDAVTGGGEIGTKPRLNVKWVMPRVYDGVSFVYANEPTALTAMSDSLSAVYNTFQGISKLNFRINISTELLKLNSGSSQAAILINYEPSEDPISQYKINASGNSSITAHTRPTDGNGFISFDLIGRKDKSIDMSQIASENYGLPDGDIIPGTVYYMNIKPTFVDAEGNYVDALKVGTPDGQNGSTLKGLLSYTYTPIRFKLTKDAANNVYVQVYRINQGSLDMPGFYYDIQASDVPTQGDWPSKAKMTDRFFPSGSEYAVTVIPNVNPNNKIYYKIVVKTDNSTDRVESQKLPYTLDQETSRPPVVKGIGVADRALNTKDLTTAEGETLTVKSTDVTFSWEKPANWDQIKNDMYFHILLNTSQVDSTKEVELQLDGRPMGSYQVKYRWVKYVSASRVIDDGGNTLKYTLNGFDLFKGDNIDGTQSDIANPDGYPGLLLPNTVYFIQIVTTKGVDEHSFESLNDLSGLAAANVSEKSVPASFTTLSGITRDVPLPKNFRVNRNEAELIPGPDSSSAISNFIELQFDKVSIEWGNYISDTSVQKSIFYDLYMSTGTDSNSFINLGPIGTTQSSGDVIFVEDPLGTFIKATIRTFSPGTTAYGEFGAALKPNTTYYFVIKTRLSIAGQDADRESSMFTAILPVTTVTGSVQPPDDSAKRPLAPTDFAVAKDASGNLMLSGSKVTFNWLKKEPGVKYTLICTSTRVAVDAEPASYQNDPVYQSFHTTFGDVLLDPEAIRSRFNFEYDDVTKLCNFTIDQWIFPNKLYFFSIRAEKQITVQGITAVNGSAWVSIPVTTLLIDSPASLEALYDSQLGFNWVDNALNMRTEDYKIYLQGPKDANPKLLNRSQFTIAKDGSNYYGRIFNLEPNTSYEITVYKGINNSTLVYQSADALTRDAFHEVEVKWKGQPGYKYELAIKTPDSIEYNTVLDSDLEQYTDNNGHVLPYYIEKNPQTVGTVYSYFYAKIKTAQVILVDESVEHQPLKSDTKYYVKVRAIKIDPLDTTLISYSKFVGPTSMRTEFSQKDYDTADEESKKEAVYLDKIKKMEESFFWRLSLSNNTTDKILLKGDRIVNAIQNNGGLPFMLDISNLKPGTNIDVIYMPISIFELLNTEDRSFIIKASDAEYTFRPRTLEVGNISEIEYLHGNSKVKDIFLKITITRTNSPEKPLPEHTKIISRINDFEVQAIGSSKTEAQLKSQINDKLYNNETGLIKQKGNLLSAPTNGSSGNASSDINTQINNLVAQLEKELSDYIDGAINGIQGLIVETKDIKVFSNPLLVKLSYGDQQGLKLPYAYYDNTILWQKITLNNFYSLDTLTFNPTKTGKFAVLVTQTIANAAGDVPDDYWAKDYINKFMSKFDLGSVFGSDGSLYPDNPVTVKELILLYDKVTGVSNENAGLDIKQTAKKLGIDTMVNPNFPAKGIVRQEISGVIIKLYCTEIGVNLESLKPRKNIFIKDEKDIDSKYYKSVLMCADLGLMTLNEGNFFPESSVTRAQSIVVFVRLLEKTGDI